ncbi:hypothetical protein R1sor_023905 [Riccia sorocarpa]|uniref:Uncharacterized protein n=1 Tax=Riccia sorocarpa TaxID=122646 RepID=A0ABD3GT19_9MARC
MGILAIFQSGAGAVQGLHSNLLSFEGRAILLRFLVQTKLAFLLSLVTLRSSQLRTIRALLRSFFWGQSQSGKPKVPLVGWDLVAATPLAGGLGVWDLRGYLSVGTIWAPPSGLHFYSLAPLVVAGL